MEDNPHSGGVWSRLSPIARLCAVAGPAFIVIVVLAWWLIPGASSQEALPEQSTETVLPVGGVANACLGGWTDMDQAVLTAHAQAPITQAGAAEFAATLARWNWRTAMGEGMYKAAPIGSKLLAPNANAQAKKNLNSPNDFSAPYAGWRIAADAAGMKYHVAVKSADPLIVAVSAYISVTFSKPGVSPEFDQGRSTSDLIAIDGKWFVLNEYDTTNPALHMSKAVLEYQGTTFAGGCV